jgi:hypothetical protein
MQVARPQGRGWQGEYPPPGAAVQAPSIQPASHPASQSEWASVHTEGGRVRHPSIGSLLVHPLRSIFPVRN